MRKALWLVIYVYILILFLPGAAGAQTITTVSTMGTVTGTGFEPGTTVYINGTAVPTTYVSPTQLTITIPASVIGSLTVSNPALQSIAVTPTSESLIVGGTTQLAATGTYSSGPTQNLTSSVSWLSANTAVASVSVSGLVMAVGPGTTTISSSLNGITSNSIGVTVTAPPSTSSLWSTTTVPANTTGNDSESVELGVQFQSSVSGQILGIRFYEASNSTGTHTGALWSSTGTLLASGTFASSSQGWQTLTFSSPISISANTTYVASYHTSEYAWSEPYFTSRYVNGILSAPVNAGVYAYSSSRTFPTSVWDATNYWVDVIFSPSGPAPLAITTTSLPSGTVGTPYSQTLVASGGTPPYTWAVTSGSLPSGFSLSTQGEITGTATSAGTSAFTVTVTDSARNTASLALTITMSTSSSSTIFYDDFTGASLSSDWTIISRHGEYAQNETECNVPQEVSVANSDLIITTAVGPATCGDFNTNGSVRHSPSSWPYITGDVQWTNLNFTYGTVEVRAQFPAQSTGLWPAIWLLGSNCQVTNIYTADTGYSTCPSTNSASYAEIDMVECDLNNWCQLALANYANTGSGGQSFPACGFHVDTNFHVYDLTWTATSISLSMDGNPTGCSYSSPQWTIPSTPMFLIIQTQTGPAGGTPNNSELPAQLVVDYVTVTQP